MFFFVHYSIMLDLKVQMSAQISHKLYNDKKENWRLKLI